MASGDSENVVLVSGLPEGYKLIELKKLVGKLLKDGDALSTMRWINESDGTQQTSKAELRLQNKRDKSRLLDFKQIAAFFNEDTHFFVFSDGNQTNQQKTAAVYDVPNEDGKIFKEAASTISSDSSPKEPMTSRIDAVTVQLQQRRRLYCGDIPKRMFLHANVKSYFQRFGEITDIFLPRYLKPGVRPFAKVVFRTHDMAMAAIRYHGASQNKDTHGITVVWDRVEARQIRQKLEYDQGQQFREESVARSRASTSTNQSQRPPGQQSRAGDRSPRSSGFSDIDHHPSQSGATPIPKPRRSLAVSAKTNLNLQDKSTSSKSAGESTEVKSVASLPSSHRPNTRGQSHYKRRYDNNRDHQINRPSTAPTLRQPARLVVEFKDTPELDTDVVHFIRKSRRRFDALYYDLADLTELEVTDKTTSMGPGFVLIYKPKLRKLSDNLKRNQKRFETTCREISSKFFASFVARSATFDKVSLAAVRRSNRWNVDHDFLKVKVEDESFAEAYVRWSVTNPALVTVTGPEHDVTAMLTYLKDKCDIKEESVPLLKWQYRAMVECDVIRGITDELKDKVSVKHSMKDEGGLVTFRGPSTCMNEARTKLTNALMWVTPSTLTNEGSRTEFLLTSLTSDRDGLEEDKVNVRQRIQEKFKSDKVLASLQLRGEEVCLLYTDAEQHRRALSSLKDLVKSDSIEVSEGFEGGSNEWKLLSQNVCSTGSTKVYLNKQASTIEVVGLWDNFDGNLRRVRSHVIENAIVTSHLKERHIVVRYLNEFRRVFRNADFHLQGVKVDYVTEGNPSIVIKGKTRNVEKANKFFREQSRAIQVRIHVIQVPGIPRYFRDRRGKEEVEEIARRQQSIAIVDPSELERSKSRKNVERTKSSRGAKPKIVVRIPSSTVTLRLIQCDITDSDCDAIVNATNLPYMGIFGAIMMKGGESIQREMTRWKNEHHGNLGPGEVAVTNAGMLPFKRIIHVVGPTVKENTRSLSLLHKCVTEALRAADKEVLTSIAIPATSCGVFGGNAHVCVPAIVEAVKDFAVTNKVSSVKRVDFVENSNESIISEFKTTLTKLGSPLGGKYLEDINEMRPASARRLALQGKFDDVTPAPVNQLLSQTSGIKTVNVIQGDITASKCDVIVSTTIDLSGVIGKAIVMKGGPGIAAQLANGNLVDQRIPSPKFTSKASNMIVTNGGNLACKYIFHINPPDSQSVTQVLLTLYENADALGLTSFAMPAIGTGGAGLDCKHVAKCCSKSIVKFRKSHPNSSLRTIEIVIFQQNLVPVFKQEFAQSYSQGGKPQAIVKQPSILPKRGSSVGLDSVNVLICSQTAESANKVWKSIQGKIDDLSTSIEIEDNVIEELDRLEQEEILTVMKKRNVKIEHTKTNVLTISGLHTNVLETCNDVQSLIHEFKQAQQCAQFIQWKYVDPADNVAKDFPLRTNQQLEIAFKKNEKGTIALDVYLKQSLVRYSFDFRKMEQTCLHDNNTSKIKRKKLTGEDPGFPPTWEDMGNNGWMKFTLTQGPEYNAVLQKFKATMPNIRVVKLERIQSIALYKQFLAQKAKVESRMGVGSNVVHELFHGTAGDVCDSICHNGFDRSHAGKNATMFGKGVYFAVGANFSNGYATRAYNNYQRMFLADVVTGQHCVGNQSMIVPPMQANGSPCDSVTDNNLPPSIYVVFKDASVYPSYLLTYQ